jgi:hypothetical protein
MSTQQLPLSASVIARTPNLYSCHSSMQKPPNCDSLGLSCACPDALHTVVLISRSSFDPGTVVQVRLVVC